MKSNLFKIFAINRLEFIGHEEKVKVGGRSGMNWQMANNMDWQMTL